MFIRLKTETNTDVNVNINQMRDFTAQGDYTLITFADGSTLQVLESTRSIRGYVKKALFAIHTGGNE